MRISDWSSDVCSSDLNALGGRRVERAAHVSELFFLIEVERLAEERFLVAEGGVEAGPCDPHRLGKIGQRGAFIALAPEHAQCRGERVADVEFARPALRSARRRVGKAGVSTCTSRWS